MRYPTLVSGFAVLAFGAGLSLPAQAVTQSRTIRSQGGTACSLSIPTTDTKVRPKAIGFRNEGTTNAFIICGYPTPNGALTQFNMNFTPIDGAAHTINCTGVNGPPWSVLYSSKSAESSGSQVSLVWTAEDFGGTAGSDLPNSGYMSVTCTLPGQVSVDNVYVYYNEDVGT